MKVFKNSFCLFELLAEALTDVNNIFYYLPLLCTMLRRTSNVFT